MVFGTHLSHTISPSHIYHLTSNLLTDNHRQPEFAHPYYTLEPHAQITVASPAGGEAPLDPNSVEAFKDDEESSKFLKEKASLWKNTEKLSSFIGKAKDFDAIFFVGGHGRKQYLYDPTTPSANTRNTAMFDLATDSTSHDLIREFKSSNKIISAVCHGPAALVNVKLADGSYLIKDSPITGFSNTEEDQVQMTSSMPFMLEDELNKNSRGKFEKAKDAWAPHVVMAQGGKLITGQNPASAGPVGQAILKALGK